MDSTSIEDFGACTPGPWELRDHMSAGLEIWAPVNIGGNPEQEVIQPIYRVSIKPQLTVGDDGRVNMLITYEDWRQFSSPDFKVMQQANARLIRAAPAILAGNITLRAKLKEATK